MQEHPEANNQEGKGAVIFPDDQPHNSKQQNNAEAVKEDPPVVKACTEDNVPEPFIHEIRQDTPDCTEDNKRPCMKDFVQDEPDDQANNEVAQDEHMPIHSVQDLKFFSGLSFKTGHIRAKEQMQGTGALLMIIIYIINIRIVSELTTIFPELLEGEDVKKP